jgi:hypothetical protein
MVFSQEYLVFSRGLLPGHAPTGTSKLQRYMALLPSEVNCNDYLMYILVMRIQRIKKELSVHTLDVRLCRIVTGGGGGGGSSSWEDQRVSNEWKGSRKVLWLST